MVKMGNQTKMGRPPKAQEAIDKEELVELLKFFPSREEVADWFKVSPSSIDRFIKKNFKTTFDDLRNKSFVRTKIAIKRAQIKKALTGDNTMLIWTGKQYLGQSDKNVEVSKSTGSITLKYRLDDEPKKHEEQ
jgi:transposase